jgi:hypothetical protein
MLFFRGPLGWKGFAGALNPVFFQNLAASRELGHPFLPAGSGGGRWKKGARLVGVAGSNSAATLYNTFLPETNNPPEVLYFGWRHKA